MTKELIPLSNANQIVGVYEEALRDIGLAISMIQNTKIRLKNTFGQHYDNIFKDRISDSDFDSMYNAGERLLQSCKDKIKQEAWSFIVDKIQIKTLLSIKRAEELERQLTEPDRLPEVTEENIFAFINTTVGNAKDMVEEALQEVFEILRPHKNYNNFKTNSEFEIGKKVFFNYWMDTQFTVALNYHRHKDLHAIEKLLCLLDGKSTPKYPDDIVTVIDQTAREKKWMTETEYFKISWYKKGSIHLEFKRMDLVKEINKRAGGMRLKGEKAL